MLSAHLYSAFKCLCRCGSMTMSLLRLSMSVTLSKEQYACEHLGCCFPLISHFSHCCTIDVSPKSISKLLSWNCVLNISKLHCRFHFRLFYLKKNNIIQTVCSTFTYSSVSSVFSRVLSSTVSRDWCNLEIYIAISFVASWKRWKPLHETVQLIYTNLC